MDEVRQAHLPGNFELYDPESSEPGAALCKGCWEEGGVRNFSALDTVWIKEEGREAMLWLCRGHLENMKSKIGKSGTFLRSVSGVVRYPALNPPHGERR
ncbi:MAG TPA: hypothetical protein VGR56_09535 [Nitrososphaerales archaeon]|nr:hypothetical protein [Nitrososphaerales archaeon]